MNVELTKKDFFYCYDIRLSIFLNKQGFRHLVEAIHTKSNKKFYLYFRTDELTIAIDKYHEIKAKRTDSNVTRS